MALNTFTYNYLTPLHFKRLINYPTTRIPTVTKWLNSISNIWTDIATRQPALIFPTL